MRLQIVRGQRRRESAQAMRRRMRSKRKADQPRDDDGKTAGESDEGRHAAGTAFGNDNNTGKRGGEEGKEDIQGVHEQMRNAAEKENF